jgi:hypothetical protein
MSDALDYFRSHAVEAVRKARRMAHGRMRNKQRIVARVYHQLAKAAYGKNPDVIDDFKAVASRGFGTRLTLGG